MIPIELGEHFSHIVNDQLRQLAVVVLDHEAKEFAVPIVHNVANLFLERERSQMLQFEAVVFVFQHVHSILDLVGLFDLDL